MSRRRIKSKRSNSTASVQGDSSTAVESDGGRRQGIFWCLTTPYISDKPGLIHELLFRVEPEQRTEWLRERGINWLRGQLERGETTDYMHYQLLLAFSSKKSKRQVVKIIGVGTHASLSRSSAADAYVWKDATRVGVRFEYGSKPIRVNSRTDYEQVWRNAQSGRLELIEPRVRVVSYRTLKKIAADHALPPALQRSIYVFWGSTGTGKSRRAWFEAGQDAFPKCPRSKFWCGYRGQKNVVVDEFRGGIDISHILRWGDRYPVHLEVKGSSEPMLCERIWITSNLHPSKWYPDLDQATYAALERRFTLVEEMSEGLWEPLLAEREDSVVPQ